MSSEYLESAEFSQEEIFEELEHDGHKGPPWIKRVGLSTMIMASLVAIGALMAGITANELIIKRTEEILEAHQLSTDQLQIEVLKSKHAVLSSMGQTPESDEVDQILLFEKSREAELVKEELREDEAEVRSTLEAHEIFAISVTLLSIALTLSGVAILYRKKGIWFFGLGIGAIGTAFMVLGLIHII